MGTPGFSLKDAAFSKERAGSLAGYAIAASSMKNSLHTERPPKGL